MNLYYQCVLSINLYIFYPVIKLGKKKFLIFIHEARPTKRNKCMGYLGLEPRTNRLKAEYSTIELATRTIILAQKLINIKVFTVKKLLK